MPRNKAAWPKTLDEAVEQVICGLSSADKETIRKTLKEDLIMFHHSWGQGIRNGFGLWQGNEELLNDCRTAHADDCSMKIITRVWEELRTNSVNPVGSNE